MKRPLGYDPSEDSAILLGIGSAHAVAEPASSQGRYCGRIVLPDSQEATGYRDWYVYKPADERSAPRPLGFRRP